jgi:uncharacterized protein (DUF2236 family)
MMARINRERVLLIGGQRALIMQLAHPKVAAGVAEHSDFPARAMERLRRTLDLSLASVFGSEAEAAAATQAIRAVHDRVAGTVEGEPYAANDPALLQWVNATLIDTTLVVYRRFVSPLTEQEEGHYYAEAAASSVAFGIPEGAIPADLPAFRRYLSDTLAGGELRAMGPGRRLVRDVLRPPLPVPWSLPSAFVRLVTMALLPVEIRRLFGLEAGVTSRLALAGSSAASRALLPLLPTAIREFSYVRARRAV